MSFRKSLENPAFSHNSTPFRYMRLPEVCGVVGLSKSTVYRLIAEGRFPKPVKLGARSSGFSSAEIDEWMNDPAAYSTTAVA